MDDWLARFAAALGEGLPADAPAIDLGPAGEESVRALAELCRQRPGTDDTAFASFLAGCFVALRATRGGDPVQALDEVVRVARRLLDGDVGIRSSPTPPGV